MRESLFNSQSNGKHPLLLVSFLVLIIAFSFAFFTSYSNYMVYPVFAVWILSIFGNTKCLTKNESSYVKISFALLAIVLLYWFIGYSVMDMGVVLREINWLLSGVIAVFALKIFSKRELSNVFLTICLSSFVLLLVFIRIGRNLMAVGQEDEAVLVASAWYGSLFMLISGLSLIVFLHVKKTLPRIISLVVFTLTLYLNFFVLQRGINVIFSLAEIGMILVFTLKRKSVVYALSAVILVATVFAYTSGLLIVFFDWFADIIPSERLAIRFREVSVVLAYEDMEVSTGSLYGRSELMSNSWQTFTSSLGHIVFGAGEHSRDHTIIGHHSFFLDTLARYGIIGGIMVFAYFYKQYQIVMSELNKKNEWALYMQCATVFLFYVLRNYFGILSYALVNLVLLVLFPLTFQLIHYYRNKSY